MSLRTALAAAAVAGMFWLSAATAAAQATTPNAAAAQQAPTAPGAPAAGTATTPTLATPQPYKPGEFPPWLHALRRGEVITVGVFPFALVYTGLMFDLGRYLVLSASGNPNAGTYAPWFFAPPDKPPLTSGEKLGIVLGSIGVSIIVGVIDYAINSAQERAAAERATARAAAVAAIARSEHPVHSSGSR